MNDLYLIPNSTVLNNLLGITNEKELDLAEAELSRANMMLLYENSFSDFSSGGFCFIHKFLFGDVYERTDKNFKPFYNNEPRRRGNHGNELLPAY